MNNPSTGREREGFGGCPDEGHPAERDRDYDETQEEATRRQLDFARHRQLTLAHLASTVLARWAQKQNEKRVSK